MNLWYSYLYLHWLRDQILALPPGNRWHSLARAALRDDLYTLHSALTKEVLQIGPAELDVSGRIEVWMVQNVVPLERWLHVLNDIKSAETSNLTMLSVAVHGLENLIHYGTDEPTPRLS